MYYKLNSSFILQFILLIVLSSSCKGQTNMQDMSNISLNPIDSVCTSTLEEIYFSEYNKRLEFNVYYTWGFSINGKYNGFESTGEVVLSWMICAINEWMVQLYENPSDAPVKSDPSINLKSNPIYYDKNYYVLKYLSDFSYYGESYSVINLEEYIDGDFYRTKILILKKINGIDKIVTRIEDETLKDLIRFHAFVKYDLLNELEIGGYKKPTTNNPIFKEAYSKTRAEALVPYQYTKNFVLKKFLRLIKEWEQSKEYKKIDYFYNRDKEFIGVKNL